MLVGASIYYFTKHERASKIEHFLNQLCLNEVVYSSDPNTISAIEHLNKCEYGQTSQSWSLAALPDYELITKLTDLCLASPGGITEADRIANNLKALSGGQSEGSQEMCRTKVREAFPEFK